MPDNETILQRWGQRFQVSPRNAFSLLACVGADCAGAVRFLDPDRLDTEEAGGIDWLTEDEVAGRLLALRSDISSWRAPGDDGQFSLAGAQSKTALLLEAAPTATPRTTRC